MKGLVVIGIAAAALGTAAVLCIGTKKEAVGTDTTTAQEFRALVGTYTENTGAEGVYLYSFSPLTAEATLLDCAPSGNPSFVVLGADTAKTTPGTRMAYSVNEYGDGRQGISAYRICGNAIKHLSTTKLPKGGEDPCNLLFTGKALISSNYSGGTISAASLDDKGELKDTLSQHLGTEEFKKEARSHIHCSVIAPGGRHIFVTDLGKDCIYSIDLQEGTQPLGKMNIAWENKEETHYGPRHLTFSSDGRFAYLICELSDHLIVFSHNDGNLTQIQDLLAYDGQGHGSADIHISPDGKFLYTSHRLKKDGIATFAIDSKTGKVSPKAYTQTGIHPRNFAISPDGKYLLCACRDSGRIEIYQRNKEDGMLTPSDKNIEISAPVCIQLF